MFQRASSSSSSSPALFFRPFSVLCSPFISCSTPVAETSSRGMIARFSSVQQQCCCESSSCVKGDVCERGSLQTREESWEDKLLACQKLLDSVTLRGCAEARGAVVPDDGQVALCGKLGDVALTAEAVCVATRSKQVKKKVCRCLSDMDTYMRGRMTRRSPSVTV